MASPLYCCSVVKSQVPEITLIDAIFLSQSSFNRGWSSPVLNDPPASWGSLKPSPSPPPRAAAPGEGAADAATGLRTRGQNSTHCGMVEPSSAATSCQRSEQPSSV